MANTNHRNRVTLDISDDNLAALYEAYSVTTVKALGQAIKAEVYDRHDLKRELTGREKARLAALREKADRARREFEESVKAAATETAWDGGEWADELDWSDLVDDTTDETQDTTNVKDSGATHAHRH